MSKTLTKSDIVELLFSRLQGSHVAAKEILEKMLQIMKQAICEEKSLRISGFGKFESYDKSPRRGRNPQTKESILLPPRRVVAFRLSKRFRAELNAAAAEDGSRA